jgi:uncharacterized protein
MWLRSSVGNLAVGRPHPAHPSKAVVPWIASLAIALAIGPFIVKRAILLGEHGYAYWLTVDYVARCISLVGVVLGFPSGLLARSHPRTGVFTSLLVLLILVAAELSEQIVAYPMLRHYFGALEFSSMPAIPNAHVRAADLSLGLLLVALSEELVFRRFLFAIIERWCQSAVTVVLTSAVMFALIHLTSGVADTLSAFVHDVFLGGAFWKTRRISVCVVSHYLVDLYVFAR